MTKQATYDDMGAWQYRAENAIKAMQRDWWEDINKRREGTDRNGRTVNERCFDSGVFASSRFIKLVTGDDKLALAMHEGCIWRQREHELDAT